MASILRTYKTYNITVGFSKYEFNKKLMSDVTLIRRQLMQGCREGWSINSRPTKSANALIYIYIYIYINIYNHFPLAVAF